MLLGSRDSSKLQSVFYLMNPKTLKFSAATTCAAVLFTACAGQTPGEQGATAGAAAGILAGALGAAAGMRTSDAVALGVGVGAVVGAAVYYYAKYEADEQQRRIAENNARRAYAARAASLKKKNVRYIAVKTTKGAKSQGQAQVMVWDTQNQQLVGNTVYDVKSAPASGSTAKFDSYNAVYVGG